MDLDQPPPLRIWAVSDGRAGIDNQVLGLAEAVARLASAEITRKRIGWKAYLDPLPPRLNPAPRFGRSSGSSVFAPPWPDLWIAAGRASLPLSVRVRRWSAGATFVVQLQDPRLPPRLFDLVVPPRHDLLEGEGVLPMTGSPHRATPERLAAAAAELEPELRALPRPLIAVLIGGRSKAFDLPAAAAARLADLIEAARADTGGALLTTFSRRTPEAAREILTRRLRPLPGRLWEGEGPNPYFAFLGSADYIVVTKDSVNMVAEAASTGRPIYVADVPGEQWRKTLFHEELSRLGAVRPFEGRLEPFAYPPLRETERVAAEILVRLRTARGGLTGTSGRESG